MIYLDNGTTTQPLPYVISQMEPYLKRHWQCPTAPYLKGKEPYSAIQRAEDQIRALTGAEGKEQFTFISSAAEGVAQVFQHVYFNSTAYGGKNHFLTTPLEGASILMGIENWEPLGCVIKKAELNRYGQLTKELLTESLSPRTAVLSLSWANSFTGVIHPIAELAELCKERGVLLHVDASDIVGKMHFQLSDIPIDFLTFDGDRMHGPKGSGALLTRAGLNLQPLIPDALGKRGGTLNLPALVGLGAACREAESAMDHVGLEIARLRNLLEEGVRDGLPDAEVLFEEADRLPHISCMTFPGVPTELLAFHLREAGIFVGFGGGQRQNLENVLTAAGVSLLSAQTAMSFNLSSLTTEEEIRTVICQLADSVQKCRTFSQKVVS